MCCYLLVQFFFLLLAYFILDIMMLWEKEIPSYLTTRKNVIGFILFTAVFALIFINIYEPFESYTWRTVGQFRFFLYSSIVILIGMLVIVISRLLMNILINRRQPKYGEYAIWIAGEIFLMALVYSIIQEFFLHVDNDFMLILKNSTRNTALVILLPYSISWLYLALKDKYNTLEKVMEHNSGLEESIHGRTKTSITSSMYAFKDEKGVLKFSIKKDDVLFLEAADNYIIIHYLDNNKQSRFILRTTLKKIESEFRISSLIRCHRSFMVNIDRVKMIRKDRDGLIVGFESPLNINIPISKTYIDTVIRKLSLYSSSEGIGE